MLKKIILFFLFLYSFLFAREISLMQFLKDFSNYHKVFYSQNIKFILPLKYNITDFINSSEEKQILNKDINTLQYFLREKLNKNIILKKINLPSKTIYYITLKKETTHQTKVQRIIYQLKKIRKEAMNLPNFNSKNFNKDIEKIILKLKEYKRYN